MVILQTFISALLSRGYNIIGKARVGHAIKTKKAVDLAMLSMTEPAEKKQGSFYPHNKNTPA